MKALSRLVGTSVIVALAALTLPREGLAGIWVATLIGAALFAGISEQVLASRCSPRLVGRRGSVRLFIVAGFAPVLGVLHAATGFALVPLDPFWGLVVPAALVAGGCTLRHAALRALGPLFVQTVCIQEDHRLVRHGPYRWVRNPALVGYFLFFLGLLLLTRSAPALLIGLALSFLAIRQFVRQEEAALELAFGNEFREYREQVGRYLPRIGRAPDGLGRSPHSTPSDTRSPPFTNFEIE